MERADPLFLLIGLPTIPVMLILGKMVRWEDYVLRLWRKHSAKLPLVNYLWPDGNTVLASLHTYSCCYNNNNKGDFYSAYISTTQGGSAGHFTLTLATRMHAHMH